MYENNRIWVYGQSESIENICIRKSATDKGGRLQRIGIGAE